MYDPGFSITPSSEPMGFVFGEGCFGPEVENRRLDDIRAGLLDPDCDGPEIVYSIAMDVGKNRHRALLAEMFLLYGVVTYAAGRLGVEPVRSQGHIHAVSPHCGWSTPEVYEIWQGRAAIFMQERVEDDPGRCFVVYAGPGEVVIVPPGWAHATISADPGTPLTFGAWCDRQYGFEYGGLRARGGIAWHPVIDTNGAIRWRPNPSYDVGRLIEKSPEAYGGLGLQQGLPIYTQFEQDHERFRFVPEPALAAEIWKSFVP